MLTWFKWKRYATCTVSVNSIILLVIFSLFSSDASLVLCTVRNVHIGLCACLLERKYSTSVWQYDTISCELCASEHHSAIQSHSGPQDMQTWTHDQRSDYGIIRNFKLDQIFLKREHCETRLEITCIIYSYIRMVGYGYTRCPDNSVLLQMH